MPGLNQRFMVTALIRKNGKYLLLKRSEKNRIDKGKWQFPEGGIEFGETPLIALQREMKEETKMEIEAAKIRGCVSFVVKYANKKLFHILRIVFACQARGEIKLSKEHDGFGWFRKEEIRGLPFITGFSYEKIKKML